MELAENAAARARKNGSAARALTLEEAKDFYPEANVEGAGAALLYGETGNVDAYRTMQSYVAGARAHGAEIREFTPVTHIHARNGRIERLETPGGAIVPGTVVLACGPWSHKVARSAGLHLPIQPSQVGVSFYRQPPDFYDRPPVFSVDLAIIPWHNKHFRVLCDRRDPLVKIEPDPTNAVPPQWMVDWTTEVIERAAAQDEARTFPGGLPDLLRRYARPETPPGYIAGYRNLFLDCGWSGRGFKFSVALGEYNAKWIMEGKTELDLAPWLASRFLGA